jgi:hypothetical protein
MFIKDGILKRYKRMKAMIGRKYIYIYIYIDTPSARRPRYIYGLILRETIELGKNP